MFKLISDDNIIKYYHILLISASLSCFRYFLLNSRKGGSATQGKNSRVAHKLSMTSDTNIEQFPELLEYISHLKELPSIKAAIQRSLSMNKKIYRYNHTKQIPPADIMEFLVKYGEDGDYSNLKKISKDNARLLFEYWDILYPMAAQTSKLGMSYFKIASARGLTRTDMTKKVGLSRSKLSVITNGKYPITYKTFTKLVNSIGIDPLEFLYSLLDMGGVSAEKNFGDFIREGRLNNQITVDYAASSCNMSESDYLLMEQGKLAVSQGVLASISSLYNISYLKLARLALNACLVVATDIPKLNLSGYEDDCNDSTGVQDGNLVRLLVDISKKNYIVYNNFFFSARIWAIFMLLCLMDSTETRKAEKFCLLNRLKATKRIDEQPAPDPDLCFSLVPSGISADSDYIQIINDYRERYKMTDTDLTSLCGAKSSLSARISKTGRLTSLRDLYAVHCVLDLPVVVGLHYYIDNYPKYAKKKTCLSFEDEQTVSMNQIDSIIDSTEWKMIDKDIPSEHIKKIFHISLGKGLPTEKIWEIENIKKIFC